MNIKTNGLLNLARVAFLASASAAAPAQTAETARILDSGGGLARSTNVTIRASLGGIGGISMTRRTNVVVAHGFIGQLVTVRGPTYTAPPEVDLSLGLVDAPDPVVIGDYVTYGVTITNFGPDTASGVTVTGELPASLDFESATLSQGSRTHLGQTVTWNVGELPSNGSAWMIVAAQTMATGTVTFTMSASAQETDLNPANNTATQTTTVGNPPVFYVWNGANPGDWSNPDNWTPTGVPGGTDTATISSGRAVVSADVVVANVNLAGTLTANATLQVVGTMNLSGTLEGPAVATIKNLNWTAGTLSGPGPLNLAGGGTNTIRAGPGYKRLSSGATVNNAGTLIWTNTGVILGSDVVTFNNLGRFEIWAEASGEEKVFAQWGGYGMTFNNTGTLVRFGGTNSYTRFSSVFNNHGTVEVQAGALYLDYGHSGSSHSGSFVLGPDVFLGLGGPNTLTPGSRIRGDEADLYVYGPLLHQGGELTARSLAVSGSTVTLDSPLAVPLVSVDNGGSVAFLESVVLPKLNLLNGTLVLSNTVTVTNFDWTAGTLSGPGPLNLAGGGTNTIRAGPGYKRLSSGATVNNAGTLIWTNTGVILGSDVVTFNNLGRFEIWAEASGEEKAFAQYHGYGMTFNNTGTLVRFGGTNSYTRFSSVFNNHGTVEVQAGALYLDYGHSGSSHSGSFVLGPNVFLGLGGPNTLTPGSRIRGAEADLYVYGPLLHQGDELTVRSLGVSGIAVTLDGPLAVPVLSVNNGGSVVFRQPAVLPLINLPNGTLVLSNTVTITNFNWTAGTLSGPGPLNLTAGGATTINAGPGMKWLQAGVTVNNAGTLVWTNRGSIVGVNEVVFNNLGRFEIWADEESGEEKVFAQWGGYGMTFNNTGTLVRFGGTSSSTRFSCRFTNHGIIEGGSGGLNMTAGYSQTAGALQLQGGNVYAPWVDLRAGALAGVGTLWGNVTNNGQVNPGTSPGRLAIQGNYTQTANGALNIELGGLTAGTEFDQLQVSGTASLDGWVNVSLVSGFVPALSNRFQVLACNARSGAFATVTNDPSAAWFVFVPDYQATHVDLVAGYLSRPRFQRGSPVHANGQFSVQVEGPPGQEVVLEATGNLETESWTPILTNAIPFDKPLDMADPDVMRHKERYYRLRFGR